MRPDFLTDEDMAAGERVIPRGARERSPRAPSADRLPPQALELTPGVVVAFHGLFADVLSGGELHRCALRGRLETADSEDRSLLVVGDRVEFSPTAEREGVVERRLERTNTLVRGDKRVQRFRHAIAANVDRVMLIASVQNPRFRPGIVDRFLVAASSQELPALLVVNKIALAADEKIRADVTEYRELYAGLGLRVISTSATERTGLDEFAAALAEARTVLVGHSGVGKTTLLNAIDSELDLPVRPVNRKTGKGTHMTSVARLLRLSSGDWVIDTPGVRELDIIDLAPSDLEAQFPEFLPLLENCEKDNCSHRSEPGCAIKRAVEAGEVHPRRHESYLAMFESLMKAERPYARR